jgi:hypothetical protein
MLNKVSCTIKVTSRSSLTGDKTAFVEVFPRYCCPRGGHGALTSRPHVSIDLCVLTPGEVSTYSRLALPKAVSITPMFLELVLSTLGVSAWPEGGHGHGLGQIQAHALQYDSCLDSSWPPAAATPRPPPSRAGGAVSREERTASQPRPPSGS